MKKTLILLIVLLFAIPLFAKDDLWFNGSFDEAVTQAKQNGKKILIDFYSSG